MTDGLTYDTGALIAAERRDRRFWSRHAAALNSGITPTIPAPVLAEAWRGGAGQDNLSRLLRLCYIEPLSPTQARAVGALAGRSGHSDIVDVTVVEGALRRNDIVVTSDRGDITRVAGGRRLAIRDV